MSQGAVLFGPQARRPRSAGYQFTPAPPTLSPFREAEPILDSCRILPSRVCATQRFRVREGMIPSHLSFSSEVCVWTRWIPAFAGMTKNGVAGMVKNGGAGKGA
jgi:hypothetical protein